VHSRENKDKEENSALKFKTLMFWEIREMIILCSQIPIT
jgi:hypothetical protein